MIWLIWILNHIFPDGNGWTLSKEHQSLCRLIDFENNVKSNSSSLNSHRFTFKGPRNGFLWLLEPPGGAKLEPSCSQEWYQLHSDMVCVNIWDSNPRSKFNVDAMWVETSRNVQFPSSILWFGAMYGIPGSGWWRGTSTSRSSFSLCHSVIIQCALRSLACCHRDLTKASTLFSEWCFYIICRFIFVPKKTSPLPNNYT